MPVIPPAINQRSCYKDYPENRSLSQGHVIKRKERLVIREVSVTSMKMRVIQV